MPALVLGCDRIQRYLDTTRKRTVTVDCGIRRDQFQHEALSTAISTSECQSDWGRLLKLRLQARAC